MDQNNRERELKELKARENQHLIQSLLGITKTQACAYYHAPSSMVASCRGGY